jgi:DNA-binding response OmpR family regulator
VGLHLINIFCEVLILCGLDIVVGSSRAPTIIVILGHHDANMVVSGVLNLKGCKVYKSTVADDCLRWLNRSEPVADAIIVDRKLAREENFRLVEEIRKINQDVALLILTDNINEEEERLMEQSIDEFVVTPISAENLADKTIMLLAKKELKKIKNGKSGFDKGMLLK